MDTLFTSLSDLGFFGLSEVVGDKEVVGNKEVVDNSWSRAYITKDVNNITDFWTLSSVFTSLSDLGFVRFP